MLKLLGCSRTCLKHKKRITEETTVEPTVCVSSPLGIAPTHGVDLFGASRQHLGEGFLGKLGKLEQNGKFGKDSWFVDEFPLSKWPFFRFQTLSFPGCTRSDQFGRVRKLGSMVIGSVGYFTPIHPIK